MENKTFAEESTAYWDAKYPKAAARRKAAKRAALRRRARKAEEAKAAARRAAIATEGKSARAAYMAAETAVWTRSFYSVKIPSTQLGPAGAARNAEDARRAAANAVIRWQRGAYALKLKAAADAEAAADISDLL